MMDLKLYLATAARGTAAALARALGVSSVMVTQWAMGEKTIPAERCPDIERFSEGALTCEALRSDRRWCRIPDPDWPWHPEGKPLLDVATPVPADTPTVGVLSEQD